MPLLYVASGGRNLGRNAKEGGEYTQWVTLRFF